MTHGEIYVLTSEVRRSADAMEVVAVEASTSRAALADSISGLGSAAWKTAGRSGFAKFIDSVDAQAGRLRAELIDLGDKLRAAADAYDDQDAEGGAALDVSVRYH